MQEDNYSIHKSKVSKAYTILKNIRVIDWPPNSPDLSPIENLWAVLKQRIQTRAPKALNELKRSIEEEWLQFDPIF